MESKNLNDIVIEDNDNSKKAQLKNILTLLALLFIILVISIVITKLILGSDEENGTISETESNKTELTQSDSSSLSEGGATAATVVTTAALATGVAVLGASSLKDDKTKESSSLKDEPKPLLTERNTTSRKKPSLRDHQAKDSDNRSETKKSSESTKSRSVKEAYVPRRNSTPPAKKVYSASATRGYYIKVGAFKDPSNAIKEVKEKHLRYKKINTNSGAVRVLVGPYYSRKDAQNDLSKVKKIAADAYITKIK